MVYHRHSCSPYVSASCHAASCHADKTMNWKQALKTHYSAPLDVSFRQFRLGLSLFFCGMVILYGANQLLQPSLQQELMVLLALLVGGLGFLLAMMAQLRMVISRLWHFFARDHLNEDETKR